MGWFYEQRTLRYIVAHVKIIILRSSKSCLTYINTDHKTVRFLEKVRCTFCLAIVPFVCYLIITRSQHSKLRLLCKSHLSRCGAGRKRKGEALNSPDKCFCRYQGGRSTSTESGHPQSMTLFEY